jgi:uncharacterized protein YegP (UPF0339 family)
MSVFEIYLVDHEYRWRLIAEDDVVIAKSGVTFLSKAGAANSIEAVKRDAPSAPIVDLTERPKSLTVPRHITRTQFAEALRLLGVDPNKVQSLHITWDTIIAEEIVLDGTGNGSVGEVPTRPVLIRVVP